AAGRRGAGRLPVRHEGRAAREGRERERQRERHRGRVQRAAQRGRLDAAPGAGRGEGARLRGREEDLRGARRVDGPGLARRTARGRATRAENSGIRRQMRPAPSSDSAPAVRVIAVLYALLSPFTVFALLQVVGFVATLV